MLKIETGKCPQLDALSTDYYNANVNRNWAKIREVGQQISVHLRYCETCNKLGLINKLFSGKQVAVTDEGD